MKLKQAALRGLIILAVTVALCMFFARTVQTITTPKVRLVTAGTGRFEDKMTFQAELFFPETDPVTVDEAARTPVTIDKVLVKPGYWVNAGDTIFTCKVPGYADEMKKLRGEYDAKSAELMALDVTNRKLSRESRQNELYREMADAQEALTDALLAARTLAAKAGVTVSGDVSGWSRQLALFSNVPEEVTQAVEKAQAASAAFDAANDAYLAILENRQLKVSTEVFEYIEKRNTLRREMDALAAQMVELSLLSDSLTRVTTDRSGYITAIDLNSGDTYDGSKPAYTLNADGVLPVLRVSMDGVTRAIADGTKAEIETSGGGTEKATVQKSAVGTDGKRYLYVNLPDSMKGENNSAIRRIMSGGPVTMKLTYRASQNATLIAASAVRMDGDAAYVYAVKQERGSFLSAASMKVVKTNVTVLERSDKIIAVAEEFGNQSIADREDRALSDGQAVMEYVD